MGKYCSVFRIEVTSKVIIDPGIGEKKKKASQIWILGAEGAQISTMKESYESDFGVTNW